MLQITPDSYFHSTPEGLIPVCQTGKSHSTLGSSAASCWHVKCTSESDKTVTSPTVHWANRPHRSTLQRLREPRGRHTALFHPYYRRKCPFCRFSMKINPIQTSQKGIFNIKQQARCPTERKWSFSQGETYSLPSFGLVLVWVVFTLGLFCGLEQ